MKKSAQQGFTLVEVAIIVPIILVIALALFEIIFAMVQANDADRINTILDYDKENVINTIEPDVVLTNSFLDQPDATMSDPNAPGGTWSFKGSSSTARTLILRTYATTTNPLDPTRQPVYVGNPLSSACSPSNLGANPVLSYDTIYFVINKVLYRRRLVDSTTATCNNQYQLQSCPQATSSTACPADEVVADNVTNFSIDYYLNASDTAPLNPYVGSNGGEVETAKAIVLNVTVSRTGSGQTFSSTTSVKLARVNMGG